MFDIQDRTLVRYNGKDGAVSIPAGVSRIADFAFLKSKVCEVVIPDGVVNIGEAAFAHCKNLKKITFPASLRTIGRQCFQDCTGLTDVSFPSHVTLWDDSFEGCKKLKSIYNPPC